jgi:hypothetical protein
MIEMSKAQRLFWIQADQMWSAGNVRQAVGMGNFEAAMVHQFTYLQLKSEWHELFNSLTPKQRKEYYEFFAHLGG